MVDKLKPAPLAYQNEPFLSSPDGRILRILAEYQEPLSRFAASKSRTRSSSSAPPASKAPLPPEKSNGCPEKRFQGSRFTTGKNLKSALAGVEMARYYEDARRLAYLLTKWSIQIPARRRRFVVTTGGGPGIMEAATSVLTKPRQKHRPQHQSSLRAKSKFLPSPLRSISNFTTSSCASSGSLTSLKRW